MERFDKKLSKIELSRINGGNKKVLSQIYIIYEFGVDFIGIQICMRQSKSKKADAILAVLRLFSSKHLIAARSLL